MRTHYQTLGVKPDAAPAELRAAYLAKARALHPDRHVGEPPSQLAATERAMRDVNQAWSVLGDPTRRRAYDATLRAAAAQSSTARPASSATRPANGSGPRPTPGPRSYTTARNATARNATTHTATTGAGASYTGTQPYATVPPPRENPLFHIVRMGPVLVLLAVLGVIFVFTAFAAGGHSSDSPSPPTVAAGTPQKGNCLVVGATVRVTRCDAAYDAQVIEVVPAGHTCTTALVPLRWDERTWLCVRPRQ